MVTVVVRQMSGVRNNNSLKSLRKLKGAFIPTPHAHEAYQSECVDMSRIPHHTVVFFYRMLYVPTYAIEYDDTKSTSMSQPTVTRADHHNDCK